jgi:hypothetical protein
MKPTIAWRISAADNTSTDKDGFAKMLVFFTDKPHLTVDLKFVDMIGTCQNKVDIIHIWAYIDREGQYYFTAKNG